MDSERDRAVREVVQTSREPDSNLNTAFIEAENKRLELENAHEIDMRRTDLGWFGKVLGSAENAPMVIAFLTVLLGFATAATLWVLAYRSGHPDPWLSEAHFALGAALSALGYVFGRGSRSSSGKAG